MRKDYKTIREVVGPLMLVDQVEGVKYDELVEIQQANGEIRQGKVLVIDGDKALVQLFESSQGLKIDDAKARFLGHGVRLGVSPAMLCPGDHQRIAAAGQQFRARCPKFSHLPFVVDDIRTVTVLQQQIGQQDRFLLMDLALERGAKQSDHLGPSVAQPPGQQIGRVAHPDGGLKDMFPVLFRYEAMRLVAEYGGNRGTRHVDRIGDMLHGDPLRHIFQSLQWLLYTMYIYRSYFTSRCRFFKR